MIYKPIKQANPEDFAFPVPFSCLYIYTPDVIMSAPFSFYSPSFHTRISEINCQLNSVVVQLYRFLHWAWALSTVPNQSQMSVFAVV